jgi:hypothetical protein
MCAYERERERERINVSVVILHLKFCLVSMFQEFLLISLRGQDWIQNTISKTVCESAGHPSYVIFTDATNIKSKYSK